MTRWLCSVTARYCLKARHTVRARFVTNVGSMATVKALLQHCPGLLTCEPLAWGGPGARPVWWGWAGAPGTGGRAARVLRMALWVPSSAPRGGGWLRRWPCHPKATLDFPAWPSSSGPVPNSPTCHLSCLTSLSSRFCLEGLAEASKGGGSGPATAVRVGAVLRRAG